MAPPGAAEGLAPGEGLGGGALGAGAGAEEEGGPGGEGRAAAGGAGGGGRRARGPRGGVALLPLGNRALLHYPLRALEGLFAGDPSGLARVTVVVPGEGAAQEVREWLGERYRGSTARPDVVAVAPGETPVGSLQLLAQQGRLVANSVLVMRGDLVTALPLQEPALQQRMDRLSLVAVLAPRRSPLEGKPGKAPKDVRYVGLDRCSSSRLLLWAGSTEKGSGAVKQLGLTKGMLFDAGGVDVRVDLLDTECYFFDRVALEGALVENPELESLADELVPWLVRSQFVKPATPGGHKRVDSMDFGDPSGKGHPNAREGRGDAFLDALVRDMSHMDVQPARPSTCGAYIGPAACYCARVNSVPSYAETSRDLASEVHAKLTGHELTAKHNFVAASVEMGNKSSIGGGCIVGEDTCLGERSSVKRSVVGAHCTLGNNVKVVNSVIMEGAVVGDGCHVQNCIICQDAVIEEKSQMKDCQVGACYTVAAGSDHRDEVLVRGL